MNHLQHRKHAFVAVDDPTLRSTLLELFWLEGCAVTTLRAPQHLAGNIWAIQNGYVEPPDLMVVDARLANGMTHEAWTRFHESFDTEVAFIASGDDYATQLMGISVDASIFARPIDLDAVRALIC